MVRLIVLPRLAILAYQDFKTLSVSRVLLISLVIIQFLIGILGERDMEFFLQTSIVNVILITLQLFLVSLYFKMKAKMRFVNTIMGVGDLLFLLFVCFLFSPLNLEMFLLLSFILTLAIHLVWKDRNTKIPLIGYMALFSGIVLIIGVDTFDDTFLLTTFDNLIN